jgi:hypothetical protein
MFQYDAAHTRQGSTWQLLLERVPADGTAGDHQSVEQVTNALWTLGLQPAEVERIGQVFVEALQRATQGEEGEDRAPASVRIWILGLSATVDPYGSGPGDQSVRRRNRGGWGFFLVERQEDDPGTTPVKSHRIIELYLYRESLVAKKTRSEQIKKWKEKKDENL